MTSFILFAPSTMKEFVHPGLEADSQRDFLKDIVCCWLHFKGYWRWLTATRFLIRRSQPTSKWYSYCSTQADEILKILASLFPDQSVTGTLTRGIRTRAWALSA